MCRSGPVFQYFPIILYSILSYSPLHTEYFYKTHDNATTTANIIIIIIIIIIFIYSEQCLVSMNIVSWSKLC
jgi:hypothetical protein